MPKALSLKESVYGKNNIAFLPERDFTGDHPVISRVLQPG